MEMEICILRHNFWTIWDLEPLSTSNWASEPQFCQKWTFAKQLTNGRKLLFVGQFYFESETYYKMYDHEYKHVFLNTKLGFFSC